MSLAAASTARSMAWSRRDGRTTSESAASRRDSAISPCSRRSASSGGQAWSDPWPSRGRFLFGPPRPWPAQPEPAPPRRPGQPRPGSRPRSVFASTAPTGPGLPLPRGASDPVRPPPRGLSRSPRGNGPRGRPGHRDGSGSPRPRRDGEAGHRCRGSRPSSREPPRPILWRPRRVGRESACRRGCPRSTGGDPSIPGSTPQARPR